MKLKSIFQRKRRVMYEDRNTKKPCILARYKAELKEQNRRFWDFSYAARFLREHRNNIQLFELRMYHDRDVGETFVENGNIVKALNGGDYQQFRTELDGVLYTIEDIPSIHVVYKGGAEEWMACYESLSDNFANSHCKLELI